MGPQRRASDDSSLETMIRVAFAVPKHTRALSAQVGDPDRRWIEVNEELNPLWSGSDRGPMRATLARLRRSQVGVVTVCVFVAVTTLSLGVGRTPDLASIAAYESDLAGRYRDGGGGPRSDLAVGASLLVAAHARSWSGTHADEALVDIASQYLEGAYAGTADPFKRAEAAFFRAKAALMVGDTELAKRWLRSCLAQRVEDYNADATGLLNAIRR